MRPWESPFILMVDRGECTFVQKVRNAQHFGAAAVIIADDVCLCGTEKSCVPRRKGDPCEPNEPIMADDGSGGDITIPSFLMFKQHADPIKDILVSDTPVRIQMSWSLPEHDDGVDYDFWFNPGDTSETMSFLSTWKPLAQALGDHAFFTPYTFIFNGNDFGCNIDECAGLCTNNGRYCSNYSDQDVSGTEIVKESLRQLCIWKTYGKDGIGEPWWRYMQEFMTRCSNEDYFSDANCVKDCMKLAKIDIATIDKCIDVSGGTDRDAPNDILQAQLDAQNGRGVLTVPSLFVNDLSLIHI